MNRIMAGAIRNLPRAALIPFGALPRRVQRPLVEFALRQFFEDILGAEELTPFEGRWIRLAVPDVGLSYLIGVVRGAPFVSLRQEPADLTITGNLEEMILLASQEEDPDTQFFQRRITIEGDTDLGLELKNLIYSLDPERLPPSVQRLLAVLGRAVDGARQPYAESPAGKKPS